MKKEIVQSEMIKKYGLSKEQAEIIKNMICKDADDTELVLFLETCKSLNLSPFLKEVYFFVNKYKNKNGEWIRTPVIGIGINGYRKIAERTEKYSPGKAVEYALDKNGEPLSATAFVKKQTKDGTWHEVSATVFASEFTKAKNGGMFFHKLGINAESHALRKAFPDVYNGIYSKEELETSNLHLGEEIEEKHENKASQNEIEDIEILNEENDDDFELKEDFINSYQVSTIESLLSLDHELSHKVKNYLAQKYSVKDFKNLKKDVYEKIIVQIVKNLKQNKKLEGSHATTN